MKDLAEKTAFVTGAASGIGLGIATALARAGVKVMVCDIEEAPLAAAIEALRLTNADVDGVKADVSLKAELRAAAEATIARYGKVHILVNNAGVGGGGTYGAWTDAAWDWTIGVNLMGVVWGIEIFGPLIEQHGEGGRIVSTASIAGLLSLKIYAPWRNPFAAATWVRSSVGTFCRVRTNATGWSRASSATRQATAVSLASPGRMTVRPGTARRPASCSTG